MKINSIADPPPLNFIIIFSLSLFLSCSKPEEPIDPNPNPQVTGCKDCEYYPVCDGSWYTYKDSSYPNASQPLIYTDTLKSLGDTLWNGLTYKIVKRLSKRNAGTLYTNCKDGIYSLASGLAGSSVGQPIIFLKPNEPVGATWVSFLGTIKYTMTIQGKGLTMKLNGVDYSDVIKMKQVTEGSGSIITSYHYYAKGIGFIYMEAGNWNLDSRWFSYHSLQKHFIP